MKKLIEKEAEKALNLKNQIRFYNYVQNFCFFIRNKNVDFSKIRTRVFRVLGKHADNLTSHR